MSFKLFLCRLNLITATASRGNIIVFHISSYQQRLTMLEKLFTLSLTLVLGILINTIHSQTALADGTQLGVALYPYVPRLEQFKTAILAKWAEVEPNVSLNFINWDGGYEDNPPKDADVYVFDAMFFDYFRSRDWLVPMQASDIDNLDDFVDYAIEGVKVESDYYAIPQLGCANILFYRKDDTALANATTLSEVNDALSECTYTGKIPPDERGLMLDMHGGTTNASLYLDITHSLTGEYPLPLPKSKEELNPEAIRDLQQLLAMASYENANAENLKPYERGIWFGNDWGRALIQYTESMSVMTEETRQDIDFKVLPLYDKGNPPFFYADAIGVNPTTDDRGTRELAVKLANAIAATDTMVASIGANEKYPSPQYLMPARPSTFKSLETSFPLYGKMYELITNNSPILFEVNEQSRQWLADMKDTIRDAARVGYACGYD